MITASISYHFNGDDLPLLKQAAELHLRHVSPTQRLELVARWSGFSTLAGLRTTLGSSARSDVTFTLDPVAAQSFAEMRDIAFDANQLHQVLASTAQAKVARETPLLHNWGYGRGCLHPTREEYREITRDLPFNERWAAVNRAIDDDLTTRRAELLEIRGADEFLRALAFASCIQSIKTPNRRQSSYGLKHIAEKLDYSLNGGAYLPRYYVANSAMIAAAIYAGFTPHNPENIGGEFNSSPNPAFNMSERSVKALRAETGQWAA